MSKQVTAEELGIHLDKDDDRTLFRWFLASFLMGKRIQVEIAVNAYREIAENHHIDTPSKLAGQSHRQLVSMLGRARYVRYDESTAARLLALAGKLNSQYSGKISVIRELSGDRKTFEKRLAEFAGVGPKTVEIFMREAGEVLY
jgi:endonuclease III